MPGTGVPGLAKLHLADGSCSQISSRGLVVAVSFSVAMA